MLSLNVKSRNRKDNKEKLRASGHMPAVFYGKKEKSTPISISLGDFLKVWKEAGESSVVALEGEMGHKEALIHDIAVNPVTGIPQHADFYVFEKGHKLEVKVPLKFIGSSPAVKDLGGTLVKVLYELSIKAEPQNLPHEVEVDISHLATFESQILAKDIVLPKGVELNEKPEEVVALVEEVKEEVEEVAVAPDLSTIEVEKKGKKEEEEGAETAVPQAAAKKEPAKS